MARGNVKARKLILMHGERREGGREGKRGGGRERKRDPLRAIRESESAESIFYAADVNG